jgi:hypothetical protein
MELRSLFLACQHLSSGSNLRECEDQSWFKVKAEIRDSLACSVVPEPLNNEIYEYT